MEITILNAGEDETAFHDTVAGEVGTALRKAGKDYIGQRALSENQLLAMQQDEPDALSQLEADMTTHALEVVNVRQDSGVALRLNLQGSKKT
ncbi:hypothetical protein R6258_00990 [Halomonas sp. HP20-15]|uniref:hypothetical protein n=1 Tax=Halomonas sp. HP20-15 TaxID=3085901 RepID=UPI002981A252|nr:hypothetical protein [Halomonas sp. HP20-15]MDW5375481.1 hypothetical protein [Halomonas sp. HP20-15]